MTTAASYLEKLFSLEGKVVLFTGAAGGIGSALCKALAQAGASVALCDINLSSLQALQGEIVQAGGGASVHLLDVTDKENISACVEEIVRISAQALRIMMSRPMTVLWISISREPFL